MNNNELQDAIDRFVSDESLLLDWSKEAIDDLMSLMEAARLVANGEDILWCRTHDQEPHQIDYCKDRWPDDGYESCEIVTKLLVTRQGDTDE